MKALLTLLLILPQIILAQNDSLWKETSPTPRTAKSWNGIKANRQELNHEVLNVVLREIQLKGSTKIRIPHPFGDEMDFDIRPANLLAKKLQEKYPEIRTFKGSGKNGDRIRIDINPDGLHAIIFSEEGTIYVDPESNSSSEYVSYFKSDYIKGNVDQAVFIEEPIDYSQSSFLQRSGQTAFSQRTIGRQIRKYRIAIAASSPYTASQGGTVQGALQTIVTTLNRVTGIYESIGITFELIANNDLLIYDSPSSDPYREGSKSVLRSANQENIDNVIGFSNYDLGHLFTTNVAGGQASFGHVCRNLKAAAVSSRLVPRGDAFDVSIVAHEIGHQFGAFHTFSAQRCTLSEGQYQEKGAYEMGSGSTIMSYSGLCGYNNITTRPDDYYHAISVENILRYVIDDLGNGCAELVETGNTPPVVNIQEGGFVIPINTPFVLEAEGSDTDGDLLSYCWEQFDQTLKKEDLLGNPIGPIYTREELEDQGLSETIIEGILQQQEEILAAVFEGDGPLFRSFPPTISNKRYIPKLSDVLAGDTTIFEVLPFKTRDLNFMVTVRDNSPNGGGLTNDLLSFSSSEQAGPFVVTTTFSDPSYNGLSNVTLEWDVSNTDIDPVNCTQVTVLYSTNGGESFDITLLENTPNDGEETIKLPNLPTSEARIMVKAADNIFFNVNDRNFSVTVSDVDVPEAPTALEGIRVDSNTIDLSWTDDSEVEDGFIIERQTGTDASFEEIASLSVNSTSFRDESVPNTESYAYRVAAFNATGRSAFTNIISFNANTEVVLSVIDPNELDFFHPNPVTDEIFFPSSLKSQIIGITIFNLKGQEVEKHQINKSIEKLDVSTLSKGLYLINFFTRDRVIIKKFYKE